MKFDEIANRLTGISCPIFGVSWNPPELHRDVARRIITFLEDRRILYAPPATDNVPGFSIDSVLQIREFLTRELSNLGSNTELSGSLRAMRASCRKFLDTVQLEEGSEARHRTHWLEWDISGALGEMRGVFGIHIAKIAAQYGLDVEDDLASILPPLVNG